MQAGNPPEQMEKIEHAYDYTLQSVTATIKDDLRYCSKERTAAIRADLNRYLGRRLHAHGAHGALGASAWACEAVGSGE